MKTEALYLEVYRQILNDIKTGVFARNQPLPAERVLCDKYFYSARFSDPAAHTILFVQQHAEKGQHHNLESYCQLRNAPGR